MSPHFWHIFVGWELEEGGDLAIHSDLVHQLLAKSLLHIQQMQ